MTTLLHFSETTTIWRKPAACLERHFGISSYITWSTYCSRLNAVSWKWLHFIIRDCIADGMFLNHVDRLHQQLLTFAKYFSTVARQAVYVVVVSRDFLKRSDVPLWTAELVLRETSVFGEVVPCLSRRVAEQCSLQDVNFPVSARDWEQSHHMPIVNVAWMMHVVFLIMWSRWVVF